MGPVRPRGTAMGVTTYNRRMKMKIALLLIAAAFAAVEEIQTPSDGLVPEYDDQIAEVAVTELVTEVADEDNVEQPIGKNAGDKCWSQCGQKTGRCPQFCGQGWCCRIGWSGNGCNGNMGGESNHRCAYRAPDNAKADDNAKEIQDLKDKVSDQEQKTQDLNDKLSKQEQIQDLKDKLSTYTAPDN